MTQITLSADNKKNKTLSFFTKELISGKIAFLLWMVVFFTAVTVFSLFQINDMARTEAIPVRRLMRELCSPFYTGAYLMVLAGIISGITAFSIYSSKRSAYFFLSLPVKRDTLFLARLAAGAVPPVLAFLLNAFISVFIFSSSHHYPLDACFLITSKIVWQAILMFLWAYSVTVLAASLTSRSAATAFLTAWSFIFVPIYHACAIVILDLSVPDAYAPWTSSGITVTHLNPLIRTAMLQNELGDLYNSSISDRIATIYSTDYTASLAWYETVAIILGSALLIVCAMLISRKRPAENAGESAVFPKIGELIKLTALFPAGILFGLFFSELFGIIGLYGGMIWGVFIAFLILNLLLYRSGKKLFVGTKAAVILTAVLIPFILSAQLFGAYTDSRRYDTSNTKEVQVYLHPFGQIDIDMDKSEELLALVARLEDEREDSNSFTSIANDFFSYSLVIPEDIDIVSVYNYYYDDSFSLSIIITPKFGIPVERTYRLYSEEDKQIFLDAVRASSSDGILLLAKLFPADEPKFSYNNSTELAYTDTPFYGSSVQKENLRPSRSAVIAIAERRIMEFVNDTGGGFAVGSVSYPAVNGYTTLPVYIDDLPLLSPTLTADLDEMAESIVSLKIYHEYSEMMYKYSKEGEMVAASYPESNFVIEVTDPEKIKEYIYASAGSNYAYYSSGIINPVASGLNIEVEGQYGNMYFSFSTRFRKGCVPQEVQDIVDGIIKQYTNASNNS